MEQVLVFSCIIGLSLNETSAGCTEMEPAKLKEIIYWLDASANPVLVQLTKQLLKEYQKPWQLPFPEELR